MSPDRVLTMVTKDWRQKCFLDFEAGKALGADVVAAVDPDGAGLLVVKHRGYRAPFLMMGAKVEDLTDRPTKTYYRTVHGEQWLCDAADVIDNLEVGDPYVTAQFRSVLVDGMATSAADAAIEFFLEDVSERCGEEVSEQVAKDLNYLELGTVIAEWLKKQLKIDLVVQCEEETHCVVKPEDIAKPSATAVADPVPLPPAVWLIRTHGMAKVREWVYAVRRDAVEIDRLAMAQVKDPLSPDRQTFRAGLRWLAETPDVEWERFGGDEGRTS